MRDTERTTDASPDGAELPPGRILVAEDEGAFRELLLCAFRDGGYDVVGVGNGPELRGLLVDSLTPGSRIAPFDLVVSDVIMPGGGGLEVLEGLGRGPRLPPVILMTAFGSAEVHERARRAGAFAILDKPFDLAELTSLGARLLARRTQ